MGEASLVHLLIHLYPRAGPFHEPPLSKAWIFSIRNTFHCLGPLLSYLSLSFLFALPLRYKGRRPESHAPHVPNQPSEAAAHFYFELAKTVLIKAGGNSSTSIFTHPSSSGGHQGPHRNLHLCAFEIGLYALGLHNFVSPNWLSRTYSSHVSWITGKSNTRAEPWDRQGWGLGEGWSLPSLAKEPLFLHYGICFVLIPALQAKQWRSGVQP